MGVLTTFGGMENRMNRFAFAAAALAISGAAFAQFTRDLTPQNMAFRGGFVYPWENATRAVTGNMIGVGLDFFGSRAYFNNAEAYVSVDWFGKSSGGAKGNMFPVLYNHRFYMGEVEPGKRSYLTAGLGLIFVDVTSSKTTYGGRLGVGKEINQHIFGEATITLGSNANGARANTFGAYIGYRF